MFSICVPSYNSLEYLKIFYRGLQKNTKVEYELKVHDNGSTDGTKEWLGENKISWTGTPSNEGFCAVNLPLRHVNYKYSMIMNTDMYPLPGWDEVIVEQIKKFENSGIDKFTISSRLIEPIGANPEYTIFNAGVNAKTFNESYLLGNYIKQKKSWSGINTIQYSHPILVPTSLMHEMNYLDEQYFPGWAVDHDLAASAYKVGCRNFVMLGNSRVYHFSSKTFTKLPNEVRRRDGQDVFLKKWGMTVDEFRNRLGVKEQFRQVGENVL